MIFNSAEFAAFFLIFYLIYLFSTHTWQNRFLLLGGCVFYGAWNWKFLFLPFATTIIDYNIALKMSETDDDRKRRLLLTISILANLSVLGFFKYYNFFAVNLQHLAASFGLPLDIQVLNIVLPVGISFYTFQAMSYTIDVYRKHVPASRNFLEFALFVSFFPQLEAGPIERAGHMLPQMKANRKLRLDWIWEGLYLILWGLFQKMFVADNLAKIVNPVFGAAGPYSGLEVLFAVYAFAFQIFCDFAGYSNIARGLARLMGFDIIINFNLPYFSQNPSEFWQRWHISLSRWLRDYLYISLGGNRKGNLITFRNLMITMILGGLWHGANWTFVVWGFYHGLLLVLYRLIGPFIPEPKNERAQKIVKVVKIVFFFHLVCLGWLFFRAESLTQALHMIQALAFNFRLDSIFSLSDVLKSLIFFTFLLIIAQIYEYRKNDLLAIFQLRPAVQMAAYLVILYAILLLGVTTGEEFIYFQF